MVPLNARIYLLLSYINRYILLIICIQCSIILPQLTHLVLIIPYTGGTGVVLSLVTIVYYSNLIIRYMHYITRIRQQKLGIY